MPPSSRIPAMDVLRGCAVMGILWMNITAFAQPQSAYINPAAAGPLTTGDIAFWAISLILVDGKMRGLFAMLFGASMLLLIDREEMAGRDGTRTQMVRAGWLFAIGAAHYLLLWWGDILTLYALVGLAALRFAHRDPMQLVKAAFLFFLLHFLLVAGYVASFYAWSHASGGAQGFASFAASLSDPASPAIQREIALYRSDFLSILLHKIVDLPRNWFLGFTLSALESLGFMLLGMAMLKGGFLTARWDAEQYRRTARHCFLIGVPPMGALAIWVWASGFAALPALGTALAWSFPFRVPLSVGWAALILWLFSRNPDHPLASRLGAAGRLALSNYLGTSLVMTAIFYGWGLGNFAHVPLGALPLFVAVGWAAMLLWSQPYADRFATGPAEWVWRSLVRAKPQKIRKSS